MTSGWASVRTTALALALAACGSVAEEPPPPSSPPAPATLRAERFALANGLQVDVVSGEGCERGALTLLWPVGSDHDPEGRSGMARVVAQLLAAESPGADVHVEHGHLRYEAPFDGPDALDALASRLSTVREIDEARLEEARGRVLAELAQMRGGDPTRTAESYAVEAIQPSAGDGWRGGVQAEIESIDVAAASAFGAAALRLGHAQLVIVGPSDAGTLRPAIERALGAASSEEALAARAPGTARVLGTLVMGDAPSVIVIAVPAPAIGDPLYAPFLVHATRLIAASDPAYEVEYDWVARPETAFVRGSIESGESPEAAALRIRAAMATPLSALLTPADATATRERFARLVGTSDLDPQCREPSTLATSRARRAQLGIDSTHLDDAIGSVTEDSLREAATAFDAAHATAVAGGGTLR